MPRFTVANAREMAARSVAARKAAEAERTCKPAPATLSATLPAGTDPYVVARLSRVRRQLDRLDELLSTERDPQRIDRLSETFTPSAVALVERNAGLWESRGSSRPE